ncbi:MAG: MCE family protein [Actinobacteria bacterium]|jgi:phospholipid/cholesterol/gamma-HCH transport system substrate-binding protein|nr:MCE family protein [Actinomycetota bacterium]
MVNRLLAMHKVLGVAFLALLVLGVYTTYAIFTKQFVDYDEVTLKTSNIGLQLPKRADIKTRGVLVGEVLDYEADADGGAVVTLGLYPDKVDMISQDVTGSILPKTLFGEKFVSLVPPDDFDPDSDPHIEQGDVIEKTQVSTEVERVLSDLLPLLRTVQPEKINMTLNALQTALEGRGEQLGATLETFDDYLKKLNPEIPGLVRDLRKTADVAEIYNDVLPQLGDILDDTVRTTDTLETREQKLNDLFVDVSGFSETTRTFLADNEENIVRVGELGQAQFRVLSRYSTEIPCLTAGIVTAGQYQAEAFRNFTLHIVLETLPRQPRAYNVNDQPRIGETRGPNCLNLPDPPWNQDNPVKRQPDFDDGVDEPTGKGTSRVATSYAFRDGQGFMGGEAESSLYRSLIAPSLGVPADQVGDLGPLLVAPMARGASVSLR